MNAKLIIYFLEGNDVSFRILPSLRELKLFLNDHSTGGLIHLSLNPPPPSAFSSKLSETGHMLFMSISLAYANCNSELIFDKTHHVKFGELVAYPLRNAFGILQNFDENFLLKNTGSDGEFGEVLEVPDELLSDYLFSARTTNVFEAYDIKFISDLLQYSEQDLLRLANFGRKSLTEINVFLEKRSLKLGQKKNLKFVALQPENASDLPGGRDLRVPSQIITDFKLSLETLEERLKQVIIWRSGIDSSPLVLEEIGQSLGVTRERVRQLEANGIKKLMIAKHSGWQCKHYSKIISEIFNRAQFAITSDYLYKELDCSSTYKETSSVLGFVFDNLLEFKIYKFQLGDLECYTRIDQSNVHKLINICKKVVKQSEGKSLSSIIDEFSLFVPLEAKELTKDIVFHLLRNSVVKKIDQEPVLLIYSERRSATTVAYKIIDDAKKPINTEQIQTIIKDEFPDYGIRNVINSFATLKGIFPFRHGVWGSVKHLPFDEDEIKVLKIFLDRFSEELEAKQFHARDFLKFVEAQSPSIALKTDEFQISGFIRNFSALNYLGRNMFSDKDSDLRRVFIHDIVVEVLLRNGKPMHSNDIKEQVNKIRSISETYQIQTKSPIKLLGGGVYSLEFWDLDENDYVSSSRRKRVSPDEEQVIRDLWLRGEPASYIGRKLSRSPGVIYSVVSRLGIQRQNVLSDLFS